jgi:hypothetical protein
MPGRSDLSNASFLMKGLGEGWLESFSSQPSSNRFIRNEVDEMPMFLQ